MRLHPATFAAALLAAALSAVLAGCEIEPYAPPIQIPSGYVPPSYQPSTSRTYVSNPWPSAHARATTTSTNPVTTAAAQPPVIDDAVRDQVLSAVQSDLARKFPADPDPQLSEYLMLVGSLLTINSQNPDVEYRYVLLKSNEPISFVIWPKTIYVSRGLVKQMEDESELAGVLAREIANLQSGRTLQAAGLPLPPQPTTRSSTTRATTTTTATASRPMTIAQTALVNKLATKLTGVLLREPIDLALEQAADLEGARLAASAKYAPDGFLKLLTRQKPTAAATTAATATAWDRIKTLDANVQIIAKAHPSATAKLPARFEAYVKPPAKPDATANP